MLADGTPKNGEHGTEELLEIWAELLRHEIIVKNFKSSEKRFFLPNLYFCQGFLFWENYTYAYICINTIIGLLVLGNF